MYHFISAFQSSVYFLSLPLPWFFSLEISSFFFPRALKSLPESEPWLLFIFIFNIKCADILQALFWLISSVVGKNGTLSIEVKSLFLKHCILYQLFGVTVPFFFSFWLLPLSSIMSVEKFWNEAEKYLKHFSSCFRTSCLKNVILNLCIHSLNTQVPILIRKVNSLFMAVVSLMSASRYSHSLLCIPW